MPTSAELGENEDAGRGVPSLFKSQVSTLRVETCQLSTALDGNPARYAGEDSTGKHR
jgi:hypothetical protein